MVVDSNHSNRPRFAITWMANGTKSTRPRNKGCQKESPRILAMHQPASRVLQAIPLQMGSDNTTLEHIRSAVSANKSVAKPVRNRVLCPRQFDRANAIASPMLTKAKQITRSTVENRLLQKFNPETTAMHPSIKAARPNQTWNEPSRFAFLRCDSEDDAESAVGSSVFIGSSLYFDAGIACKMEASAFD